jgi:hypothetical protein
MIQGGGLLTLIVLGIFIGVLLRNERHQHQAHVSKA